MYSIIPIIAIVFTFGGIVAIVAISLKYKSRKIEHKEIMKSMELGQELPSVEVRKHHSFMSDLRMGIILLTVGVGFYAFMKEGYNDMARFAGLGLIPAFIGAGMIVMAFLVKHFNEQEKKKDRGE